jgi:glycosyltransferase involved in cell wall biosynthesis
MAADTGVLNPFFSIGITTYNRHELLQETLQSVLSQSFGDFEIIVGNDYQAEILTGEMLGISDPRVRFVNHPINLREIGNMNALLAAAKGRYFTWLFDDDLYEPDYLMSAHSFLSSNDYPPALFSSFSQLRGSNPFKPQQLSPRARYLLTGRDFLKGYFAGRFATISTSGLFDTARLKSTVGGMEELCSSAIGLYGEYLFLVKCALFDRIAYIDAPFVVMRMHNESWSQSNLELYKYVEAGKTLVKRCGIVFSHPNLSPDFKSNLLNICKLHLFTFAYKSTRLEIAHNSYGICAAYRAISRYAKELVVIIKIYTNEVGIGNYSAVPFSLPILIKHVCLILVWLAIFWVRQFFPSFMRLTRSYIPQ